MATSLGKRKQRASSPGYKGADRRADPAEWRSTSAIVRENAPTETAVRRWVKQAEIDAGRGDDRALTTTEREELVRMRRENRRLQMEQEIQRKAAAFFARESR